jgi:hypothetical protein
MVEDTMSSNLKKDKSELCEECDYIPDCTDYFSYCVFTGKKVPWTKSDRLERNIEKEEDAKDIVKILESHKRDIEANFTLSEADKIKNHHIIDDLLRKFKDKTRYTNPRSCDICGFNSDCKSYFLHCPYFSVRKSLKTKKDLLKKANQTPIYRCKICKEIVSPTNLYCAFCMNYEMEDSKCNVCGGVFSNFKDYEKHLFTHPRCEFCGKICKSTSELKKHVKKEHYECEYCKKVFKSEKERENHIRIKHHCKVCGNNYKLLASHMKKHPFCEICNKYFLTKDDYNKQHVEPHPTCKYCGEQNLSEIDLKIHVENHKCPVCMDFFHPLNEHLKSHPKCELCGILFFDNDKLENHMLDEHQCDICSKQFVDKTELMEHRVTHFKFKCSVCGIKFINEFDLKEHLKTHLKCSYCTKAFDSEFDLAKHLDDYHPKCELCGTRFPTKSMLKKHKHKK